MTKQGSEIIFNRLAVVTMRMLHDRLAVVTRWTLHDHEGDGKFPNGRNDQELVKEVSTSSMLRLNKILECWTDW